MWEQIWLSQHLISNPNQINESLSVLAKTYCGQHLTSLLSYVHSKKLIDKRRERIASTNQSVFS